MESPDDIVEVQCSVNWENENLYCEECSSKIESAYGDEGECDRPIVEGAGCTPEEAEYWREYALAAAGPPKAKLYR